MWFLRMFLHFRPHLPHPVNPQLHRLWFYLLLPHRYRPHRHVRPPPPPLPRQPPLLERLWMQMLRTTPRRTAKQSNLMISIRLRITIIGKFRMEILCETKLLNTSNFVFTEKKVLEKVAAAEKKREKRTVANKKTKTVHKTKLTGKNHQPTMLPGECLIFRLPHFTFLHP